MIVMRFEGAKVEKQPDGSHTFSVWGYEPDPDSIDTPFLREQVGTGKTGYMRYVFSFMGCVGGFDLPLQDGNDGYVSFLAPLFEKYLKTELENERFYISCFGGHFVIQHYETDKVIAILTGLQMGMATVFKEMDAEPIV